MTPQYEAKMKALSEFREGCESILEMVVKLRESQEAVRVSPKKERYRRTVAPGE